jgi:hypothetical protein
VKAIKSLAVAGLGILVLALSVLAYFQYRELISLRAQVAAGDAATLKRQLADAQKTIRSLQDRLAEMRGRSRGEGLAGPDGEAGTAGADGQGRRGPGRWGAFAQLANNPEFQKLVSIEARARISQVYGPLFKQLNLSPEQLNQFQSLLADKQQALMDVMQAAREQGLNPRTDPEGFKTLVNQAISQSDQAIQQALGDAGFQQYQQYQATLPERNVVNSLQQQLSYTQTPLTDDQANAMISVLQATQPQRAGNGTAGTTGGGEPGPNPMQLLNGGGNAKVTNDALAQAAGVLSAPQLSALQQIQQQQQAQQQIQQMMRQINNPPPTTTTGGKG